MAVVAKEEIPVSTAAATTEIHADGFDRREDLVGRGRVGMRRAGQGRGIIIRALGMRDGAMGPVGWMEVSPDYITTDRKNSSRSRR